MPKFVTNYVVFNPMNFNKTLKLMYPNASYHIYCHFSSTPLSNVAIFWDFNNKPPNSISILDAAICVKKTSFSFGVVGFMGVLGNGNTLRKVSSNVGKVSNVGEFGGSFCGVCGRRFWSSEWLGRHFRGVHEAEQWRRVRKVEFARGGRRVRLVGKFLMKMRRYDDVVRGFGDGNVGGCLLNELKKAGFWVEGVWDKCDELRDCVLDVVDMGEVECVVIECDYSGFVSVLKELKLRGVKVVVGDSRDGDLKRIADAAFSWQEIILGKARKEVVSVVRGWKDRDVLKSLEWSYNSEIEESR